MGIDRNAPCPCGSGKKYKRCCLSEERPTKSPAESAHARAVEELYAGIIRHAKRELGMKSIDELFEAAPPGLVEPEAEAYWMELLLFHVPTPEASMAKRSATAGPHVGHYELLAARLSAWAAVLQVVESRPGFGFVAEDLLAGERLEVQDESLAKTLRVHEVFLALVYDHDDTMRVAAAYPFALPPAEGQEAVKRMRKELGLRGARQASWELLRDTESKLKITTHWALAVQEQRSRPAPQMQNTDGDPLLPTMDHYRHAPDQRAAVLARLAEMEWAEAPVEEDGETVIVLVRPDHPMDEGWKNTVVGRVVLGAGAALRIETNSVARADLLRAKVEAACGELIRHRAREHADLHSRMELAKKGGPGMLAPPKGIPPEVEAEVLREVKEQHYATWPDHPLPALGGLTPRQAAKGTAKQRRELDELLKLMEHHEAAVPEAARYDMKRLRRELGLPG